MTRLRRTLLEHRASLVLVMLLGLFLFSGSTTCRYPIITSADLCCDCDTLTTCPVGSSSASASPGLSLPEAAGAAGGKIYFEANAGQADSRYEFVARGTGMSIFLDSGEAWLDLRGGLSGASGGVVHASLANAARRVEAVAEEPQPGRINYLVGNDASRWIKDIPTFAKIRYRDVYPGIDIVYYGTRGRLEHDFVVAPGADPRQIRLRLAGVDSMEVDGTTGDALLRVGNSTVTWKKPLLYQAVGGLRRRVEGRYRVEGKSELGFEVGVYDPDRPLVIDPVVLYSTYLGRGGNETATRMAVDASGNVYLTGVSTDNSYPTTPGAGTLTPAQARGNIVVTKLTSAANELIYSTILGGNAIDLGLGIAVDAQGAVYLTGATASDDFPTTAGVIQRTYGRPTGEFARTPALGDCFVTRLNAAGNGISFSTYLGGTVLDACSAIALDGAGNIIVAGATNSANFPSTADSFQRNFRGGRGTYPVLKNSDGFVAKLNNNGTELLYATFFGGNGEEGATGLAVDAEGNAYVTGSTNSTFGFPVSATAPQARYAGSGGNADVGVGDAFILKLNPTGTSMVYGTFLGGLRDDVAYGISVDKQGAAYITGSTLSTDFPVTAIARQGNYRGQSTTAEFYAGDAFVAKLNPGGTAWEYVTYLGGTADDRGVSIQALDDGSAWVMGHTVSEDFWVTEDATQRRFAGGRPQEFYNAGDIFLTRMGPTGQALLFSTYLGGQGNDWAIGLAADARGSVYIAGGTSSPDFPTTPGAYQRTFGTAQSLFLPLGDVFVTKFGDPPPQGGPSVSVAGIASAASYDGSAIAPGQIVVVAGTQIGPEQLQSAAPAGGAFPSTLAETRILIGGRPAPILYVSARQSSVVVPWETTGPTTEVAVEYQGVRSRPITIPVAPSAPGLFSANASGRGQAAALNQNLSVNSVTNPAEVGSIVVLYGTGEGRTIPASADGRISVAPFPRPELPVNVTIGGQRAEVVYAGAAPGLVAGVIQLNVRVPNFQDSNEYPVVLRIGDRPSQTGVTIAVK